MVVEEAQAEDHLQLAAREAQPPLPERRVQPQHLHPVQQGPVLQVLVLQVLVQMRIRRRLLTLTIERPRETLRTATSTVPRLPSPVQIFEQGTGMD